MDELQLPPEAEALITELPLLPLARPGRLEELCSLALETYQPRSLIDWLLIKDMAVLEWEAEWANHLIDELQARSSAEPDTGAKDLVWQLETSLRLYLKGEGLEAIQMTIAAGLSSQAKIDRIFYLIIANENRQRRLLHEIERGPEGAIKRSQRTRSKTRQYRSRRWTRFPSRKLWSKKPSSSSVEKIAANRESAKRSTGPRTAAGKARSSQNAYLHGLSLPIIRDPYYTNIAERLSSVIRAEFSPNDDLSRDARDLANTEAALLRVRSARVGILNAGLERVRAHTGSSEPLSKNGRRESTLDSLETALALKSDQLATIDDYDRRALSRRKFARRALLRCPNGPTAGE